MNFDKILKYVVSAIIIIFIIIKIFPNVISAFSASKNVLGELKDEYNNIEIVEYLYSKPNYFFQYTGATYCIPVSELVEQDVEINPDVYGIDDIIEAIYNGEEYIISINNECVER